MSAAARVHGIPHILDLILSHLDKPDLLAAQRAGRLLFERANRLVYRSVDYHIYTQHTDPSQVGSVDYRSCIQEMPAGTRPCLACARQHGGIEWLPHTPDAIKTIIASCEIIRRIHLTQYAWVEVPKIRDSKPILHEQAHCMLGLDGTVNSMGGTSEYSTWGDHFDIVQTQTISDEFAHAPDYVMLGMGLEDDMELEDGGWGAEANIDRTKQLAVLYDPRKLGKDVTGISVTFSPVDVLRLGEMLSGREEAGARAIINVGLENPIKFDVEDLATFLRMGGRDLEGLAVGGKFGMISHPDVATDLKVGDLPSLLDVLSNHAPRLAHLSLCVLFDPATDIDAIAGTFQSSRSVARDGRLALQTLYLNIIFDTGGDLSSDPSKDFPAFELARLLVAYTGSDFRLKLRHSFQYDVPGVEAYEGMTQFSYRRLGSTPGFVRYLHGLKPSELERFSTYLDTHDVPTMDDPVDLITLHKESQDAIPAQPTIQDIFRFYSELHNLKIEFDAMLRESDSPMGMGGLGIGSMGALGLGGMNMGGMASMGGMGAGTMGLVHGVGLGGMDQMEQLGSEAIFAGRLKAAEKRFNRVMGLYGGQHALQLPMAPLKL